MECNDRKLGGPTGDSEGLDSLTLLAAPPRRPLLAQGRTLDEQDLDIVVDPRTSGAEHGSQSSYMGSFTGAFLSSLAQRELELGRVPGCTSVCAGADDSERMKHLKLHKKCLGDQTLQKFAWSPLTI